MSYFTQLDLADSHHIDAFGRLRVSQPSHIFESKLEYNLDSIQYESGATGTGIAPSFDANLRMALLSVTAGSGTSYMQTYRYFQYQAGRSHLIRITGVIGTAVANAIKDVGYFDASNGIIYRQNGTSGMQFIRRSSTSGSPVDTAVNQNAWNIDRFDGSNSSTNPSGVTLDPTKGHILVIDLQFLSMGRVRCGFEINGITLWAHHFYAANILATPYMQTASLPIQALITCSSTATTASMYLKCAAVSSEGGLDEPYGKEFSTPNVSLTAGSGTRTHAISLRKKTTFNGLPNRGHIEFNHVHFLVTGNNPIYFEIVIGAAFSVAPTWADVNTTYSSLEYGSGGTFWNSTNGIVIHSGYVSASNQELGSLVYTLSHLYPVALDRAGNVGAMRTLTVLVTGLGGASATNVCVTFFEAR